MAVDKNKIIAEATKLVQKGSLDKAIKTYERILQEDPKDVRVLLKVGELHQKKGDDRLAAEAFKKVAETYADQGFFLKAVAVYKQIVKLDPDDVRVNERLAALYQQLGLMSDAMVQFQQMAAAFEKAGDATRLLDVLKRMVELDPENIASSIKLGELYQRANQGGQALEHFRRAADYLKKHNRADEYLKVAERIGTLSPDDLALTRELANIYLAKSDTKRALAKLQLCFKADPKDVETLNLLAQAFKELGQTSKTLSVYKELAHVHQERGRPNDAKGIWRKVHELAPDDLEAIAALGIGAAAPPAAPAAAPRPATRPAAPSPPAQAPRAPPPGPPPGGRGPPPASAAAPTVRSPAPAPPPPAGPAAGADVIPKLLTETDVYLKYGLHEKALDHLRKVLVIDPDCVAAHQKARDIHASAGRRAEATAAAEAAVRAGIATRRLDQAKDDLMRLRQLDPDHPALGELAGALGLTEEIALDQSDMEEVPDSLPLEPPLASHHAPEELHLEPGGPLELEDVGTDTLSLAPPAVAFDQGVGTLDVADFDGGDAALDAAAAGAGQQDGAVLDDEPLDGAGPALTPAPDRTLEAVLVPDNEPTDPALLAAAAASSTDEEVVEDTFPPVVIAAPIEPPDVPEAVAAAVESEAGDEEVDLSDEIDEADFFVQQGLLDEAREALGNLLAFYPGHGVVLARLEELERRAAASAPAPAAAASAHPPMGGAVRQSPSLVTASALEGDAFDIGAELAEELDKAVSAPVEDEFQYSVEDVFSQFKKGVAETVKAEDSETHYDLGIAYKEMGLLDDAVHEFETALHGSNRRKEVDCLSMIALCRTTQGRPRDAVEALRRALRSDYLTREAGKAIHYELGAALESAGDREAALWYFQKVAKVDGGYRDVVARVAGLGGGPGHPPTDESAARPAARPTPAAPPRPAAPAAGPGAAGSKKNIGYL